MSHGGFGQTRAARRSRWSFQEAVKNETEIGCRANSGCGTAPGVLEVKDPGRGVPVSQSHWGRHGCWDLLFVPWPVPCGPMGVAYAISSLSLVSAPCGPTWIKWSFWERNPSISSVERRVPRTRAPLPDNTLSGHSHPVMSCLCGAGVGVMGGKCLFAEGFSHENPFPAGACA